MAVLNCTHACYWQTQDEKLNARDQWLHEQMNTHMPRHTRMLISIYT